MYQHLLHFLNLLLLHNQINLNQFLLFLQTILVLEIFTHLYYVFFINPIVKKIIIAFPFKILLIGFSLYYFFNSRLFLIWFLKFFFIKLINNFFAFKITCTICSRNSIFNFCSNKNFFRLIWNIAFCKNISILIFLHDRQL